MIEEVQVIKVDRSLIWIVADGCEACPSCSASEGCRNSRLFTWFAPRQTKFALPVASPHAYQVGDRLQLSFSPQGLVMASTLAYLVPVLFLLTMATIGHYILALSEPALLMMLVISGGGLIALMRWLHLTKKWQKLFIPYILHTKKVISS